MKRKGLIVSSIVMVIVLIASLTTATYAWFSASSSAKIDTLTVKTVAAKGLEIGAIKYPTSAQKGIENIVVNGNLTYTDTGLNAEGTPGAGTNITFTMAPNKAFYSVSGDGTLNNTWAAYNVVGETTDAHYEENADGSVVEDTPAYLGLATQASYFYNDFIVVNTATDSKNLYIKNISISVVDADTPTTTSKLIAASTRIAVYALDAQKLAGVEAVTKDSPFTFTTANLKAFIEPYSKAQLTTGGTINNEKPVPANCTFLSNVQDAKIKGPTAVYGYVSGGLQSGVKCAPYASLSDGTNDETHAGVIATNSNYDLVIDQTADFADISFAGTKSLGLYTYSETAKDNQCYMPVRIAIWFEGEDAECLTAYAKGGGITVSVEFEKR